MMLHAPARERKREKVSECLHVCERAGGAKRKRERESETKKERESKHKDSRLDIYIFAVNKQKS